MSEQIREEGEWWLPNRPKATRSSGTLVIDGNETRLEAVMGPLADTPHDTFSGPEVILGRTIKGTLYTCVRTIYSDWTTSYDKGGPMKFANLDVLNLFQGEHFSKPTSLAFKECSWRYSNLHFWLGHDAAISLEDEKEGKYLVSSRRKREALWNAKVADGLTVANDFTFSYSQKSHSTAVNFVHFDGVRIRSAKALPFTEFYSLERRFRALVNLLADCQLEIVDEIFRSDPNGFGEVRGIARHSAGGFAKADDARHGREAVRFSAIPNFSAVVELWFAEHESLEPIANLYLHGKHNTSLDTVNRFLGVLQALERFHRTFHPGVYMPEEEYKKTVRKALLDAMPATTPASLKDRLTSAIRFGYELSLLKRLDHLAGLLPKDAIFYTVRDKSFRVRTKDTRNTMTHQISKPDHPPMDGSELYSATLRWREALLALILQRLGLPEATIITAVKYLQAREGTYVSI